MSYYRNIIESISSGFLIYNADHYHIIDCNTVVSGMINSIREKLIGRDIRELFPQKERDELFEESDESPMLNMIETHMTTNDGDTLDIILSRGTVGEPEERLLIINVLDITHRVRMENALRESRKRYHELYENVPVGLIRTTVGGGILETNHATVDILGYPDQLSLHIAKASDLYASDEERTAILNALREPGSHIMREVRFKKYSGDTIWVRLTLQRVVDVETGLAYLDGVIEDISDAKARESERQAVEAIRNRMQRMEAIETLTGGIAHEFNNILAGMSLHLQLISHRRGGETKDAQISEMEKLVQRAVHIVDGLLSTLGVTYEDAAVWDLENVLDEVLGRMKTDSKISGRIRRKRHGHPLLVRGSGKAVGVAIREVLNNALTAAGPGGVVIVATDHRGTDFILADSAAKSEAGYAVIEIHDSGPGMDSETVDRILEPYYTTEEFGKGKGLGLTRAYGIVKQHDGTLILESRPGEGTVVKLFFPIAQ